jgi:hypothetical protein
MDDDVILRSPFTGGILALPPDYQSPAFIEALITAGFTRIEKDEPECLELPAPPKRKSKSPPPP